jgi:hypothetical protein
MRSTIILTVDITHSRNLPKDAQGIADLAGSLLTSVLADPLGAPPDPKLLATAQVYSSWIQRDTFAEPECDGPNCDDIQHWAGCALYVQPMLQLRLSGIGPDDGEVVGPLRNVEVLDSGTVMVQGDSEEDWYEVDTTDVMHVFVEPAGTEPMTTEGGNR